MLSGTAVLAAEKMGEKKDEEAKGDFTAIVIFSLSLLAWLASSLLVNTMNTRLTMKIQSVNEEMSMLKSANQSLSNEISNLENKDRIYAAAAAANLDQLTDNIISVPGE